ncbi:hypothetical protein QR680_004924 [Steinernema hermaphroditum]|uniref:Uncharacterized protein n=1 Tax=Steinernema hermaphroditum TaxID=289476 RepID=A0AA39HRH8_9BILA|nr:hypothetical protein QR680_004924 [Steinernema hermaphroditum]
MSSEYSAIRRRPSSLSKLSILVSRQPYRGEDLLRTAKLSPVAVPRLRLLCYQAALRPRRQSPGGRRDQGVRRGVVTHRAAAHGVPGRPGAPRGDDEDDRGEAEVLQRADCPSSKDDLSEPLASGGLPRCVPLSEGDDEVEVLQQRGPAALDEEGLGKPRNHHRPSESAQVRLLVVN